MASNNPMVPSPVCFGNNDEKAPYAALAMKKFLPDLKRSMQLGGLNVATRRVVFDNGVIVTVNVCFNREMVDVYVPPTTVNPPTSIVDEQTYVMCVPRDLYGDEFPLDAQTQYGITVGCLEPHKEGGITKHTNVKRGNYHVIVDCKTVYSIKAPPHHLSGDITSSVPLYTQYAWTTNNSGIDVYTAFSEFVYSKGKAVYAGTRAAPEAPFSYGLIVGVGVDGKNDLHVAQLSAIPKSSGYWRFTKDGEDLGVFFGTAASAQSEAGKLEAVASLVWMNTTNTVWWVEFHTGANGLDATLLKGLDIYRREPATRAGGNRQWFYKDGAWSQYSPNIPSTFTFGGLVKSGDYDKTVYGMTPKISELLKQDLVFTHTATSISGSTGSTTDTDLAVKKIPSWGVTFVDSVSPSWPNDGAYVDVYISADFCVTDIDVTSSIPNTSVAEMEVGEFYRVTLHDRCVAGQSAKVLSGAITASSNVGTETTTKSYTSRTGSWQNYVLTWNVPLPSCGGETIVSDTISDNIRTVLYRCGSAYPSYQETYQIVACNYCSDNYPSTRVYTSDPGSYTRPPEYLIPPLFAYTVSNNDISSNMPCCEYVGTMPRNFWYIMTRKETYEWVCT